MFLHKNTSKNPHFNLRFRAFHFHKDRAPERRFLDHELQGALVIQKRTCTRFYLVCNIYISTKFALRFTRSWEQLVSTVGTST